MPYVLGIDLGTSSLKGLLMNQTGEVVATAAQDYPLIQPASGYSEQDPQHWVAACSAVFEILKNEVADFTEELAGISFSGQMHSLVLLDEEKQVLRNAILWNDVRTTKQCQEIMAEFGTELLAITKNIALEGFTLPKILWVQENEPEIWQQVRHLMLPKDYLGYWLTDTIHMDYSDATGTLLLDIKEKQWSPAILEKFAISKELLPQLIESSGMTGFLKKELAAQFGFSKEVKIFAGGADNACAAVGSGILAEGIGMASIGTSGVFLSYENSADQDYQGKLHLFNHAQKDSYYSMGVTLAAGHSLSWFKEVFAAGLSFDELLKGVHDVPVGAAGLLFTPYISGERTPHVDGKIRGSFIGMDDQHTFNYFTRAVLEGITFSLKDSQVLMEEVARRKFEKIISVGGGAKNADWLQMQADIFNAEVTSLVSEQGPGLGAAMLAAIGLNWFADLKACAEVFVEYKQSHFPIQENVAAYQKIYHEYRKVYPATSELSHELRELAGE
ncbi:xylulokinase [Enterococcus sp. LJL90]